MPVTPIINGVNYSFGNISVVLFGAPLQSITEIKYTRKQKKENNYGPGFQPVSRGYGMYEYSAELKLFTDEWKKIIAASPGRDPLQIAPFDIQVVFGGSRVTADKDVLRSCEFLEDPLDGKSGDTKLIVTIPLIVASIER